MANLEKLMGLDGAVAAGEFTPSGELVNYKGCNPSSAPAKQPETTGSHRHSQLNLDINAVIPLQYET